jgi:hypothetical protein
MLTIKAAYQPGSSMRHAYCCFTANVAEHQLLLVCDHEYWMLDVNPVWLQLTDALLPRYIVRCGFAPELPSRPQNATPLTATVIGFDLDARAINLGVQGEWKVVELPERLQYAIYMAWLRWKRC